MLANYLKVFFRLFARNRIFTFINLLGLSTGIACFVLIRLYVINENIYDRHLPSADCTYRLALKGEMSGFSFESAVMGGPFGRVIQEAVPEVQRSTTFYKLPRPVLFSRGENRFYEENIIYADSLFLEFFGYTLISGNPADMLDVPYSMILTRSGARKYFGEENPVGKSMTLNNRQDYMVTGIIEDPVFNSHLDFDILASYSSLLEQEVYRNLLTSFYAFVTYNYVRLDESADPREAEAKIAGVVEEYMGEGMRESGSRFEIFLQPVQGIHLDSGLVHELEPNGSRSSVKIFSAISILILLIACVNFVNLTTARSSGRIHEIGIRQSSGAGRINLFRQFVSESVFFALCSVFLAGILVELVSPPFFDFSGINPAALRLSRIEFYLMLLMLGVVIGFVAGLYPAFYMSRSKPPWLDRWPARRKSLSTVFRNILVVAQLCITIFLVFNSILIYKQLLLVNGKDIGINKDDLLIIPMRSTEMYNHYDVLKNEMLSLPEVTDVTAFSSFLGNFQQRRGFYVEGFERNDLWMLHHISVDPNYLEMMGSGLIMGRNFRTGSKADSNAVIINAAMMNQAGWDKPTGKKIIMQDRGREYEFAVIGVVDDFNYASMHSRVESLLIFNNIKAIRYLGLRIRGGKSAVESVGEKWTGMYPAYPFDYFYQEDYYNDLYREDQRMGSLFIYFTLLAILISVLGLFGLVLFTTARRTKEVGIRKVMGGDPFILIIMLLKEYPVLILIASILSLPASWYFAKRWLENFAFKTDISSWIYIISVILVSLICLGTILFQTLRTVRANPVNALRYE